MKKTSPKKSKSRPSRVPKGSDLGVEEPKASYFPSSGLPARRIRTLRRDYDLTVRDFAEVLDVTPKTFSRWMAKDDALSPQQSDRVSILESIFALGERVLGSRDEVKAWLHSSVFSLGGKTPLELLKTESGRRLVENALHQIEFGIY